MDRFTGSAVLSALFLSLSLAACGGGNASTAEAPAAEAPADETVSGIATPSSVSVVTAKNAAQ